MPFPQRAAAATLMSLAVSAAVGVPAASGASVSGARLAASVQERLTQTQDVEATRVTCPRRVVVRKGRQVTCQARFANGDRSAVRITLTNARGDYRLRLTSLLVRRLESQLERVLAGDDVTATVTCPGRRLVRKDDTFTCSARSSEGRVGTFDIRQTGDGMVRFNLREG